MSIGGGARRRVFGGLLAATLVLGAAPAVAMPTPSRPSRPAVVDGDAAAIEAEILVLINGSRAAAGLAPLQRSAVLDSAAREWSAHLAAGSCSGSRRYLCHRSRTSLAALAKAASAPYGYRHWAENVQYTVGRAAQSHERYMASPGHRANIMRPGTNLIGIGVVFGPQGLIWVTHEFVEAKSPPPPSTTHPCGRVTRTLAYGSRGSQVKVLQCALAALGLYTGAIDGRYGKGTKAAVVGYQAANGLPQTGKADLATRRALGISS